jgi:uncharacterized protein (TIGR02757 family)
MNPTRAQALKEILQKALEDFVSSGEIQADALAPALRYRDWHDREFAAFVCSVLAYGRVEHIKKSINRILVPMGSSPHEWLLNASDADFKTLTRDWSHRFNTSHDMQILLKISQIIYREHDSVEKFFSQSQKQSAFDLIENFVDGIYEIIKTEKLKPKNSFKFFFPKPSDGSACKRQNLFLRWMVGRGPLDLKLWNSFSTSMLIVPLDVHVLRQAHSLKLTKRKQADWLAAEEVTASLRHLDRDDPVQFDFALCHLGMNGKILSHAKKKGSD